MGFVREIHEQYQKAYAKAIAYQQKNKKTACLFALFRWRVFSMSERYPIDRILVLWRFQQT